MIINLFLLLLSSSSLLLLFLQFEGVISKSRQGIVHHLEVFHCTVPDDVIIPEYDAPCVKTGRPKGLESCMKVLGAWAMGTKVPVDTILSYLYKLLMQMQGV